MPIHPAMVEDLSAGVRDLYADAEARLLGIIARQLADGYEAPGWATTKLRDVQALRRGAQDVVNSLSTAMQLEVFDAVAEAYNAGSRAGLVELGTLRDEDARRIAEATPNARAVDRLAHETIDLVTATHRGILRGAEDGYRQVISEVSATPLLGIDTRRQATQRAMERFADRGLRTFVDKGGRAWSMTSYAEMAVRTAVGRAAVEAHGDRLRAAGVSLVIVSNAPHECPLCKPYEGRVLALDGPDGARTVEVEHAIEDGHTIRVQIAGSLDEARRAGLQHPNCRHSTSAYLPGVTRAPVEHSADPAGYEATQRQRAIERGIRRWKNRAAAAVTPEGRRAAEARVRQWQARMRAHLDEHPELIRRRERERLGAGNLPSTAPRPPQDVIEAARVRSGDARTLPEMADEQLGAALRPGVLDEHDRHRIAAEADRRDVQALLDRVRPGGRMVDALTQFSDEELARVYSRLPDDGMLRVMAEMDRRDLDAALPGARRDLIGLSDRQLADRARRAEGDELAALAAEADRRRLLAEVFPGGRLAADLSAVDDEVLGWAMRYGTEGDVARIADELDRRYPPAPAPAAEGAHTVEGQLADRAALDEALSPATNPDGWAHLALDGDDRYAGLSATERWIAEREEEAAARRGNHTREQIREMHREHVYAQWSKAEDELRGVLLSREAERAGVDPIALFGGPAHVAYARASEELKRWWADHPRTTLAEYTEQITGERNAAADTARKARNDRQNKL
ncbi:putative pilus assembly protein [Streptomyces sp. NBRC 110611]|uniref:phage minor capsid protein n=1 Tax=Streptomyces sp. NBRC 110611 TaxID=1621259 RepID=UPI0008587810|nr:phage minor capsid protein [Streptomyces sp. NBRC 110611]GAU67677.1 putative pilus assembly protein [Streptomyces sp. NBRC 110611]